MKLWTFIKSPSGNLAVFAGFILLGGVLVFRSYMRDKARAEQLTKIEATAPETGRQSILRDGSPLKVPEVFTPAARAENSSGGESRPRAARAAQSPKPPTALPISLFAGNAATDAKELSKNYAPYGRLIPCETIVTLESSRLDTPVIGLVTDDVWHDGRLVIPAGAEVHGRAALDRLCKGLHDTGAVFGGDIGSLRAHKERAGCRAGGVGKVGWSGQADFAPGLF